MENMETWPIEPHTREKHVILRKYLEAWLPKITRYNDSVIICDGFAGPGVYHGGEKGSAVVALEALAKHRSLEKICRKVRYIFVEKDRKKCASLEKQIQDVRQRHSHLNNVEIFNEEFEVVFNEQILDREKIPVFAFIDPFGLKGVSFNVIEELMKRDSCEVFITFMLSALQRFIHQPEFEMHADQFFGCQDWQETGDMHGKSREEALRRIYQTQLEKCAKYVRLFTMKDNKDVTIYDLFFGTNHPQGIDTMKDAMRKVDPSGRCSFSDAMNPKQRVLFSDVLDWNELFHGLQTQYGGKTIPWPEVEEAVRRTPFKILKTPFKEEAKKPQSRFKIINPENVRAGTLDETTEIRFSSLT